MTETTTRYTSSFTTVLCEGRLVMKRLIRYGSLKWRAVKLYPYFNLMFSYPTQSVTKLFLSFFAQIEIIPCHFSMLQEWKKPRNVTTSTKCYFVPIPVLSQNATRLDFDELSRLPITYQVPFSSCVIMWKLNWCGFNTKYYCQSVFPILVPPSLRKSFLQISTLTCFRSDKSSAGYFGWPYVDDDSTGTVTLTSWWGKKRFVDNLNPVINEFKHSM